ncbi:UNVERIFIED_CONTAM: hypothetical protein Sradi_6854800 [Sesamum radiatum]|uniref:Endonuclease/exonuclease/phosphatase n=1 Tax=Sesamum radiatum TaxID=300843 RepID=A0AAW2JKU8_SESRA
MGADEVDTGTINSDVLQENIKSKNGQLRVGPELFPTTRKSPSSSDFQGSDLNGGDVRSSAAGGSGDCIKAKRLYFTTPSRANLLLNWAWFDDYSGPGGRIWLSWNPLELDVRVVKVEYQLMHCKIVNKVTHTSCLVSVIYGDCDYIRRRDLWSGLCVLADDCADDPWCVLGDFNAIVDSSEASGRAVELGLLWLSFVIAFLPQLCCICRLLAVPSLGITVVKGAAAFGNVLTEF